MTYCLKLPCKILSEIQGKRHCGRACSCICGGPGAQACRLERWPCRGARMMLHKLGAPKACWRTLSFRIQAKLIRARQRSGDGVVRANGRPTGCFWRVRFFSAPFRFALQNIWKLRMNWENCAVHSRVLDDRFSARRLLRSFGAPPKK